MYLRRDTLAALLSANAELTLAQALEELRYPLGAIDATINPEDWFVIGQRLAHGGASVGAGGAGVRTQIGLRCTNTAPLSGLVVLEQVTVANSVATAVEIRANFIEVGSVAGFVRDSRWGTLAGSRSIHGLIVTQNIAAASGTIVVPVIARLVAGESKQFPYSAIIGPAQSLVFNPSVDNLTFDCAFTWREFDLRQR